MKDMNSLYVFLIVLLLLSQNIPLVNSFLTSNFRISSKTSTIELIVKSNTQLNYRRPKPSQYEPKVKIVKQGIKIVKDSPINISNIPPDIAEVLNYYSFSEYYKLKEQGDDEETFQYCFDYFQDLLSAKVRVKGMRSLGMER